MKYRKKPVVIEAFQMTKERAIDNSDWPQWLHSAWNVAPSIPGSLYRSHKNGDSAALALSTLEGNHHITWDDFIIQGVKGELYACKPEVFAMTYEAVE